MAGRERFHPGRSGDVLHHRTAHPDDVPGCFGCKTLGIGVDRKHLTRKTIVPSDSTGRPAGYHVEHRDGRQDAVARPGAVQISREALFREPVRE